VGHTWVTVSVCSTISGRIVPIRSANGCVPDPKAGDPDCLLTPTRSAKPKFSQSGVFADVDTIDLVGPKRETRTIPDRESHLSAY